MEPDRDAIVRATYERRERERLRQKGFGWHEIDKDKEFESLCEHFYSSFFPNGNRAIPAPFAIWDVSLESVFAESAPEDQKSVKELMDDLHRKALQAMKQCEPHAVWLVIENVNHPWYRVHLRETPDHIEDWPVELLPYGDPCYLVADDFKCGFLADLDRTISVFGAQLLDAIQRDLPMVFAKMIGRE